LTGDIQKISSRLRGIIVKILDDREKREHLIQQLSETNRDLEVAQEVLIRSEKLAGVGRLAAGLAHEVGNPLQVAMGYVELLRRGGKEDATADILERMDQELKRIHDIIQRLLEFARPLPKTVTTCDINDVIRDASSLIAGRKGFRNVSFEYALDPELASVETEPEKIRQILVNLIFNALDALPESGGTITLRTRKTEEGIEIKVEDTGCGIPEQDMQKVFDPFFTTKEPGKGTGLGLAVCLGLVESLGGAIDVRSYENQGTVASIKLPLKIADGMPREEGRGVEA
jgi:signal transduction histidine kinase